MAGASWLRTEDWVFRINNMLFMFRDSSPCACNAPGRPMASVLAMYRLFCALLAEDAPRQVSLVDAPARARVEGSPPLLIVHRYVSLQCQVYPASP